MSTVEKPTHGVTRAPAAGVTTREDFGGHEVATSAEIGSSALAAQARAEVESRYIMARRFPRDEDTARAKLLKSCKRIAFAEKAWYSKPQGQKKDEKGRWVPNFVEGLSVRFVEEAARLWGNLWRTAQVIHEDERQRVIRVSVTDSETGYTAAGDVTVEKTVERKSPKGRTVISVRTNSEGEKTHVLLATDDEFFAKCNNVVSKIRRNLILEMLPADLKEEAKSDIHAAKAGAFAADPDAQKKKHADAFAALGVSPADLRTFLGHPLEQIDAKEDELLGTIYWAIKDGETTWADTFESKMGAAPPAAVEWKMTPALVAGLKKIIGVRRVPLEEQERIIRAATGGRGGGLEDLQAMAEHDAVRMGLAHWVTSAPTGAPPPAAAPLHGAGLFSGDVLPPDVALDAELARYLCDLVRRARGKADPVEVVDQLLGGVGLKAFEDIEEGHARSAIAALEAELKGRGK